jgi:catalase
MMEGFGVHTFRLINKEGKSTYVKFHWKPKLGLQSVTWNEAMKISGSDPDFHKRDLWQSITSGMYPEWELGLQLFDDDFANRWEFDILDPTKLIPEEEVPIRRVGRMVLDRYIDNEFAETEQVAFCTQNVVPGIDFTHDPLLQGRNFSYLDTQLKRLGSTNFTELPINRPRCPVHNFFQDGHMLHEKNPPGRANYFPNSWGKDHASLGPKEDFESGYRSFSADVSGSKVRLRPESFADHYSQARMFYHSQTRIEKQHIIDGYTFELSKVKEIRIRERMVAHLLNIDQNLANAVARGLGITKMPDPIPAARPTKDLRLSPGLSIVRNYPGHMTGRKLGVYLTEGASATLINSFLTLAKPEGLVVEFIAKAVMGVTCSDGTHQDADENYEGGSSILYDSIALLISEGAMEEASRNALLKDAVNNAFFHNKFIAYTEHAVPLLKACAIDPSNADEGLVKVTGVADATAFMMVGRKKQRFWERGQVCPETA